jgi:membrane associated rhomboid family serine protease
MIPLGVDVPMKRLPWANWGLIAATVLVSLAVPYADGARFELFPDDVDSHHLSSLVLQRHSFRLYQLVTSLMQHAGLFHLVGNMIFLFVFGNAINAKIGQLAYLAAYFGIGILDGIVWLLVGSGPAVLGASAAIMGICGMFLVLYPRNDVYLLFTDFWMMMLNRDWNGTLPGWAIVLLYVVFDLWNTIASPHDGVGHLNHLVGAIAGIGLAIFLLKTRRLRPDLGEQTLLQWIAGEGPVEKKDLAGRRKKRKRKVESEDAKESTPTE